MTLATIVNASADWLMQRTATQWKIAALVTFVGGALAFIATHDANQREHGAQAVRDSLAAATAVRLHRQKDAIGARIDTQTVTLTRVLHRTDTLLRQIPETIVTREDTVRAIQGLPALRLATDSAIRACSEYQDWFARYRTVCDSLDHARTAQIDALRRQLAATKPSKVRQVVTWAAILGAGYAGYHAGYRAGHR